MVEHVFKKSPAEKAGLKPGDLILSVNGKRMDTATYANKTAILLNAPVKTVFVLGYFDDKGDLWKDRTVSISKEEKSLYLNKCLEGNCINGIGKHIDFEGAEYTGNFKNSKKDGKGKWITLNGYTYNGNWKDNKKEGRGILTFIPGKNVFLYHYWRFEGDWKNDMMDGKGKFVYHDSSYYSGEVKSNIRNGNGKLVLKDSTSYEGDWKDDKLNGKETVLLPNGDKQTGNFTNSLLEGEVTVHTKATNTTATVMYKNGKPQ